MPNYCENDLYIKGSRLDRDRFVERAHNSGKEWTWDGKEDDFETVLDFNKFIPYPQKYKDLDVAASKAKAADPKNGWKVKDGYNQGGYEWCNSNWGTKWNACDAVIRKNTNSALTYRFSTAWSPPDPVIIQMSRDFPSLTFKLKYFECGGAFQGVLEVRNGTILTNESKPYSGTRGG